MGDVLPLYEFFHQTGQDFHVLDRQLVVLFVVSSDLIHAAIELMRDDMVVRWPRWRVTPQESCIARVCSDNVGI